VRIIVRANVGVNVVVVAHVRDVVGHPPPNEGRTEAKVQRDTGTEAGNGAEEKETVNGTEIGTGTGRGDRGIAVETEKEREVGIVSVGQHREIVIDEGGVCFFPSRILVAVNATIFGANHGLP
jgi:hypothetical protein